MLDAAASQRFEHTVRVRLTCGHQTPAHSRCRAPLRAPGQPLARPDDSCTRRVPCCGLARGSIVTLAVGGTCVCSLEKRP